MAVVMDGIGSNYAAICLETLKQQMTTLSQDTRLKFKQTFWKICATFLLHYAVRHP
jgi:hypothetical protein